MAYQYTGNGWIYVESNPSENSRPSSTKPSGGSSSSGGGNTNNSASNSKVPALEDSTNYETTESSNEASKEYITLEDNVLVGDLCVVPNPNYRAKKTVLLQYLGKNLTGLYFVDTVSHTFDSNGYSQSMKVSRNGFGETIKSGSAYKDTTSISPSQGGLMNGTSDSSRPSESTPSPVPTPPPSVRTYTVVRGDTLWGIATRYYGNGSKYPVIFNANRDKISNPNLIYPGQVLKIP